MKSMSFKFKIIASGSSGNCYLLENGDTQILIEAGISIKKIKHALNFNLKAVSACVLTHEHLDHAKAIKDVVRAGIDVYASVGTITSLNIKSHRLKPIEKLKSFKIGDVDVLAFDVKHDAKEPIGFIFKNKARERLLFATDTYYIKYQFKGLTHVAIECNYSDELLNSNTKHRFLKNRIIKSHFSLDNLIDYLKSCDLSKCKKIWLLHLSDSNSHEKEFIKKIKEETSVEDVSVKGD